MKKYKQFSIFKSKKMYFQIIFFNYFNFFRAIFKNNYTNIKNK